MDWMAQLEAGIRDALTRYPISDYWVVVHDDAQVVWGKGRAREIIDERTAAKLEFRVIRNADEREKWPVGSLIHF